MRFGLWTRCALILVGTVLIACLSGTGGEPAKTTNPDKLLLEQGDLKTDANSLLSYLRAHSSEDDLKRIDALIPQLGHKDFAQRQDASKRLVAVGPPALPALRKAAKDEDKEIARRATECVTAVERDGGSGRPLAVVRLLLKQRAKGAAEALVRYLPFAAYDPDLEEEIWFGLDALTVQQMMPDPALVKALTDANPSRRALAACIVGRRGSNAQHDDVRKLLDDAEPQVRLRAAQGLLGAQDKGGVPTLTALLVDAPVDVAWQAEELLHWLAGADAPAPTVGRGEAATRKECHKAWQVWWQANGAKVDVAALDKEPRRPGLILLCDGGKGHENGSVWVIGCNGRTRWQLDKLAHPVEARLLANNRVLIAECPGAGQGEKRGVTERDLNGAIRWQYKKLTSPVTCQRLANGNTFIGEAECAFAEVTADGVEVYTAERFRQLAPNVHEEIFHRPRKLANGNVLFASNDPKKGLGYCSEWDPTTGAIATRNAIYGAKSLQEDWSIEALPGGRFLLAGVHHTDGAPPPNNAPPGVREIGALGNKVWHYAMPSAFQATRLRNGNTLVAGDGQVVEILQDGTAWMEYGGTHPKFRVVWETLSERRLTGMRVCLNLIRLGFDAPYPEALDLVYSVEHRLHGLRSKEVWERQRSLDFLGKLRGRAVDAISELTEVAANDPETGMRQLAKETLLTVGSESFPATLMAAKDKDPKVRAQAVMDLTAFHSKVATEAIAAALKDEDAKVRLTAANMLQGIAPKTDTVIPGLIYALHDSDQAVRRMTVYTLIDYKPAPKAAISALLEALKKDKNQEVRYLAAIALGVAGKGDKRVVPVLIEALDDWNIRPGAINGLASLGAEAEEAVPAIVKVMNAPYPAVAPDHYSEKTLQLAVNSFGRIGSGAVKAIPTLLDILRDKKKSTTLRVDAADSLAKIGRVSDEVLSALEAVAHEEEPFGEAAKKAIEKLREKNGDG